MGFVGLRLMLYKVIVSA